MRGGPDLDAASHREPLAALLEPRLIVGFGDEAHRGLAVEPSRRAGPGLGHAAHVVRAITAIGDGAAR